MLNSGESVIVLPAEIFNTLVSNFATSVSHDPYFDSRADKSFDPKNIKITMIKEVVDRQPKIKRSTKSEPIIQEKELVIRIGFDGQFFDFDMKGICVKQFMNANVKL